MNTGTSKHIRKPTAKVIGIGSGLGDKIQEEKVANKKKKVADPIKDTIESSRTEKESDARNDEEEFVEEETSELRKKVKKDTSKIIKKNKEESPAVEAESTTTAKIYVPRAPATAAEKELFYEILGDEKDPRGTQFRFKYKLPELIFEDPTLINMENEIFGIAKKVTQSMKAQGLNPTSICAVFFFVMCPLYDVVKNEYQEEFFKASKVRLDMNIINGIHQVRMLVMSYFDSQCFTC